MAPPAKRRRRNIVEAPEDEDAPSKGNTLTSFLLSSPSSPPTNRPPTASPSPIKTRSAKKGNRTQKKGKEVAGKTADLKTLFSKQAQRATTTTTTTTTTNGAAHDPISDDEIADSKGCSSSLVGQNARKRRKDEESQPTLGGTFSVSQRFLKPPRPVGDEPPKEEDSRPWSERFGPLNLQELAVHKRKVADVRKWLEEVMGGRLRQRVLILKGAAGSGKTTTVRLLAKDMDCDIVEWKNPVGNATGAGFVSASARFEEFLGRGRKFGALDVDAPTPAPIDSSRNHGGKKIILIEEFPNTFSRASPALASFRQCLLQHAASRPSLATFGRRPATEPITPVVIVISETLLTTTSASADSLTAHRLLGAELLSHPGVGVIEFNAVAPTFLAKALELVVQKESRKSGRRKTPGPLVLKKLGEIGDIRSAISSLEFLCLKGDQDADWGARVTFAKQKKGVKEGIGLTRGEEESLESISRRQASLGIFHAVGKVVYNKREDTAAAAAAAESLLPEWLSHCSRPKRSEVVVDALMDEMGTDTHTFTSALHENYVLSCESVDGMDLSTPMDYVNECIEYLSQSDLLCPSRDVFFGGAGGDGRDAASQLLRQDEMMFQVAVRGLLFSLPNPVKRGQQQQQQQRGGDAFRMFYPTSLKLWRTKEEIEGMVEVCSGRTLREGGVLLGNTARGEMILERLPYMAHVARGQKQRARELDKIVSFGGLSVSAEEESDDNGEEEVKEAWATDKPSEEKSPRRRAGIMAGAVQMMGEKLVLSDDDIED